MSDLTIEPRKSSARFAVACVLAATLAGCAKPTSDGAIATPSPPAVFQLEEATISQIQGAILAGQVTATQIVEGYLHRIKAYNGACVNQPDGVLGAVTPIQNARQLNALQTLNLRPENRKAWGFDDRKARSMTDLADGDPSMPDALELAAALDQKFKETGKLIDLGGVRARLTAYFAVLQTPQKV